LKTRILFSTFALALPAVNHQERETDVCLSVMAWVVVIVVTHGDASA